MDLNNKLEKVDDQKKSLIAQVYNKTMFSSFHFEILRLDFVDLGKFFLTYNIDISILTIFK